MEKPTCEDRLIGRISGICLQFYITFVRREVSETTVKPPGCRLSVELTVVLQPFEDFTVGSDGWGMNPQLEAVPCHSFTVRRDSVPSEICG